MKGIKKIVLLLLLLALGVALTACISKSISNDFVSFTVSWGGEDGDITYRGLAHHEEYGWVTSRDFYTLEGIYTLPGGRGEKIFDTMGNLVVDEVNNGDTYYAHWKPIDIIFSFELGSDATFEDGTSHKEIVVEYTGQLPQFFPSAKDENGVELSRWHVTRVNEKVVSGMTVSDLEGNLIEGTETVADHCTIPPTPNMPYVIVLTPYTEYETCLVNLDFGDGTVIRLEYETYEDVPYRHLWFGEAAGRELIGWARHPDERSEFVTEIDNIIQDVTLYAIWKPYRTVHLHIHNGKTKTLRVYEGEPVLLDEAAALAGTAFVNWYEDHNFNTVASRILTYEGNVSHYYAKFEPKAELSEGSHLLTLHYGNDVTEIFEIKEGQSIENCLFYTESGGVELIAWINDYAEPVTGGTITGDATLVAVKKAYKDVMLHMYSNLVMTVRIYEGSTYTLRDLPRVDGVEFRGWYTSTTFKDEYRVSDELTYENALAHYYARYSNVED